MRAEAEELATDALLFHQPVAGDLRAVVSAIRTAGDIERMGALARHVAQVVVRGRPLPAEVRADLARMGDVAVRLGRKAAEVVRTRNVLLAVELDADDDAMDELHVRHVRGADGSRLAARDPGRGRRDPAGPLLRAVRRPRGDRRPRHRVRGHRPGTRHRSRSDERRRQPKRPET